MHETAARLLRFARSPASRQKATTRAEVGAIMGASSATITNWTRRGISRDGALVAEREFGVSPHWLLHGEGPEASAAPEAKPARPWPGDVQILAHEFDQISDPTERQKAFAMCILAIGRATSEARRRDAGPASRLPDRPTPRLHPSQQSTDE